MISRSMWYRNPEVLYNIIMVSRNREQVFLSKIKGVMPVRCVFANYMDLLKKNMEAFSFDKRSYNLYYSLATFDNYTLFSFNITKRLEQYGSWNKVAVSNIRTFDFGLDFDSEGIDDLNSAWVDCKKVKDFFDSYGVPYSLKFSGSKGFHLTVPGAFVDKVFPFSDSVDDDTQFSFLKDVAFAIHLKLDVPTLDLGVFDSRRIWKTDYSWVCETDLIALPLSDEQFDNFSVEIVRPDNVLKNGIRNRGDLLRNGDAKNFRRMIKEGLGIMESIK